MSVEDCSGARVAKLQGHVDALGRPIVALVSLATGDPFIALIDTGFNGWLMVSGADAPTLGVRFIQDFETLRMADGRSVQVRSGRLVVEWLGRRREIEVFVSDEPSQAGEGQPIALIGAELLVPHLLMVDYGAKTVDIETQE